MTIKELLKKGFLRDIPIPELIELLCGEIIKTQDLVQSLAQVTVSKSVESRKPIPHSVIIAPQYDHVDEHECHRPGEIPETNLNDILEPIFRGLPNEFQTTT